MPSKRVKRWHEPSRGDHIAFDAGPVRLRDVVAGDLPIFFEHQRDAEANRMAAFTTPDPSDRAAFDAHWQRIASDPEIRLRTIVCGERVAGYVVTFVRFGQREIGYWLGRPFWGRGVATDALRCFLTIVPTRPLFARAASDNVASMRVLEKNGFTPHAHETAYASARGAEVAETIFIRP